MYSERRETSLFDVKVFLPCITLEGEKQYAEITIGNKTFGKFVDPHTFDLNNLRSEVCGSTFSVQPTGEVLMWTSTQTKYFKVLGCDSHPEVWCYLTPEQVMSIFEEIKFQIMWMHQPREPISLSSDDDENI